MTKTLITQLLVVVIAGTSLVACDEHATPTTPTPQGQGVTAAPFTLHGSVAGQTNGGMISLEGVAVSASNGSLGRTSVTDADGNFTLDGLTAGTWTIVLSKDGYANQSLSETIDGDKTVSYALQPTDTPASPTLMRARRK
jgi:hypothetical protein